MAILTSTTAGLPSSLGCKAQHEPSQTRPRKGKEARWVTMQTSLLSAASIQDLFSNRIPDIHQPQFLSPAECDRLVAIIETHEIGSYPVVDIWPPVGAIGIAFNHESDTTQYFSKIAEAQSLHRRFKDEAGIDLLARVCASLQETSRLPVRLAQEEEKEYFAGLLRLVNRSAKLHADFGPYDAPQYEIGRVVAQATWNILLRPVDGGTCTVHNRPWCGPSDDAFRNPAPEYGYRRDIVSGCQSKPMAYQQGSLHFFNSRNIHEVDAVKDPIQCPRYTMSSFVGLLTSESGEPSLILWS